MHISIGAEQLFTIWGFPVSNTVLTSWFVTVALIILAILAGQAIKKNPNGKVSMALGGFLSGLIDFLAAFAGDKKIVRKFLPIVATLFFFVLTSNWAGTLPGNETIGLYSNTPAHEEVSEEEHPVEDDGHEEAAATEEHAEDDAHGAGKKFLPLFRTVNSDLNMTIVFALIIVVGSHIVGFKTIGAKHHLGKFFVNPFKSPIGFFVGILEFIGEFSRIISLSFRLFGNIFAGSVLMLIISYLVPFIVPIPFLGLELFVGFIQALVISVLAVMFLASATHKHEAEH